MRLRVALRDLNGLYGSWSKLAEAMGVKPELLHAAIVLLPARAACTTVESLLGRIAAADRCSSCGRSG
jgi:pyrroloquinoline quinone (PQQ) biosynthesis protein C